MNERIQARWLLLLVVLLFLVYSPVFTTDYLMNDELAHIGGAEWAGSVTSTLAFSGRALEGALRSLIFGWIGLSARRLALARFASVAMAAGCAILMLRQLARSAEARLAFLVTALLFTQETFVGVVGYSVLMLTNVLPALLCSLFAWELHTGRTRWLKPIGVLALLVAAMQLHQAAALFVAVPLLYVTLSEWPQRHRQILSFLGLVAAAFVIELVVVMLAYHHLHLAGEAGYDRGEAAVSALIASPWSILTVAIDPFRIWSAFVIWSYPPPLDRWLPTAAEKRALALAVMSAWALVMTTAFVVELRATPRGGRRLLLLKWATVGATLLLGAAWMATEPPFAPLAEVRPHMAIALNGEVIVSGAWAIASLTRLRGRSLVLILATGWVAVIAVGAHTVVNRAVAALHGREMAFIRSELAVHPDARNLIVIVPPEGSSVCVAPPCRPWLGYTPPDPAHLQAPAAYRYALRALGADPLAARIEFAERPPATPGPDTVIVDWRKFRATR